MKSLFTIRKKKHVKHPQIIVDANRTKFSSLSLSHSETDSRHINIPLEDNPNPIDTEPSYFARKIIRDFKFNYSKEFRNYKLTDRDIEIIVEFLKTKQK